MTATLTIDAKECKVLHGLLVRRLTILAERECELRRRGEISTDELVEIFDGDLRLFDEVGLTFLLDPKPVELTMPRESLVAVLKRLRRDARRAPCEVRDEREPQETGEERWQRYRRAVDVCEELLARLDPPSPEQEATTAKGEAA